jgi:multisubunit Na+/H+ antiporter MnhG subunit
MISRGLIITVVRLALGGYRDLELSQISGQSLTALIYLTAIITIVGFTDFYLLLRVMTPSLANTFAYVSPVIAVILGALLLREPITIITIVAICVILTGVALMITTTGKDKKEKKEKNLKKQIQNKTQFNSIHSSHLALKYLCNQKVLLVESIIYLSRMVFFLVFLSYSSQVYPQSLF